MGKGNSGVRVVAVTGSPEQTAWVLMCGAFLLGGVMGHVLAGSQSTNLAQVLELYGSGNEITSYDLAMAIELLWKALRMLVITGVLSFSALGVIGLPLLLGVQGFLTGYAVSALIRTWGYSGLAAAALWVGFRNLFPLALLLTIAVPGWVLACSIAAGERRGMAVRPGKLFPIAGACVVMTLAAACSQWLVVQYLTPLLMTNFCGA